MAEARTGTRSGIDQLLYMMDSAFDGKEWHSLLGNLASVKDEEWDWVPPGGVRTIRTLVNDLAVCKLVYDSHAFGDGSIHWDRPESVPMRVPKDAAPSEMVAWLRGAHARLRGHLADLADDSALGEEVMSQFGKTLERRFLIKTIIEHDLYHCGEINHIRALSQGNDGPGND